MSDLYHEIILDHGRKPRNFRAIEGAARSAEGFNLLCGDRVVVYLEIDRDRISDISFTGTGCAICTASASLMTEDLKGQNERHAREAFAHFQSMVTGRDDARETASEVAEQFDRLRALAGVQRFPMRVKCATLPWHTMIAALDQREQPVSTE